MADLSVVVPLYNGEEYVREAIDSLLQHADGLLEILVVDDGSTDNGAAMVADFGGPVRLIQQSNSGVSAARNRGLEAARGELVGFLDADDLWVAGRPDPRRSLLSDGVADAVLGKVQPIAADRSPIGDPLSGVQLGALLAPRRLLIEHGGFDEELRFSEDLDLILRMRDAGVRISMIDEVTVEYRQHAASATRDRAADREGIVRAIRSSLLRRAEC